jgi:VanZ family protein
MPSKSLPVPSRLFAAAFALGAMTILWFSLKPMPAQAAAGQIDKVEHFAAYAGLTLLGFLTWGRASAMLVAGVLLFGVGVEIAQALLPTGRTGSVLDALANTAGAALVWAGWTWATRRRAARG